VPVKAIVAAKFTAAPACEGLGDEARLSVVATLGAVTTIVLTGDAEEAKAESPE
jgi:hypothetical protein